MPFIYGVGGWLYLAVAAAVSIGFSGYAFALWRHASDALAQNTVRFSLIHLVVLFRGAAGRSLPLLTSADAA